MDYYIYIRSNNPAANYDNEIVGPMTREEAVEQLATAGFATRNGEDWYKTVKAPWDWKATITFLVTPEKSYFLR